MKSPAPRPQFTPMIPWTEGSRWSLPAIPPTPSCINPLPLALILQGAVSLKNGHKLLIYWYTRPSCGSNSPLHPSVSQSHTFISTGALDSRLPPKNLSPLLASSPMMCYPDRIHHETSAINPLLPSRHLDDSPCHIQRLLLLGSFWKMRTTSCLSFDGPPTLHIMVVVSCA